MKKYRSAIGPSSGSGLKEETKVAVTDYRQIERRAAMYQGSMVRNLAIGNRAARRRAASERRKQREKEKV